MSDIYYKWNCPNPDCEAVNNKIPKHLVERSIITKKPLYCYCCVCGYAPISKKIKIRDRSGSAIHACECLAFEGEEGDLPLRRLSNGVYKDADGDLRDLMHFLKEGLNPDTYLNWVFHGKPKGLDLDKIDKD